MVFHVQIIVLVVSLVQCFGFRQELNEDWQKFKIAYGKNYLGVEENARRAFFEKHVEIIAKHNRDHDLGLTTFTLGLNEYADMSNYEFRKFMNGYRMPNRTVQSTFNSPIDIKDLPTSVDWRKKGVVTDIKNQEQCGSCWAFSTTGSVEGQHALKTGDLVSVSEQNLVDCSTKYGNEGCNGGWMDQAFKYIINNHGIDTEESYPYEAQDGKCRFKKSNVGATISKYVDVAADNELALQQAVASVGPVSVAIDASSPEFQLYKSGIFNPKQCSSTELDHGVLVVGYGSEVDGDYWIVKNSWGLTWGSKGYILMARNKDNLCGIATKASYPLV